MHSVVPYRCYDQTRDKHNNAFLATRSVWQDLLTLILDRQRLDLRELSRFMHYNAPK